MKIIGPFSQIITLQNLPLKGPLQDNQLEIIEDAAVLINDGKIVETGKLQSLQTQYPLAFTEMIEEPMVLLPGFIDSHTHICFGGNRSLDYAMRNAGKPYLEIALAGGGIWSSVQMTRAASEGELLLGLMSRIDRHVKEGITTIEIKSGYGLNMEAELKMLRTIQLAQEHTAATLVPTCLAAHIKPKDFNGNEQEYLEWILNDLLPQLQAEKLTNRVDIFIEETAFPKNLSVSFLNKAAELGFQITVHADQFTAGSSLVAVACKAVSADHLEASGEAEIKALAGSQTVATVLPGASIGLGMHFAPARKLLDAGCCIAIASDWNPGSAPQGDLLIQAAILGAFEKLTAAEVFAGLTFRAARALRLDDRGIIAHNYRADLQAYPSANYRDILYQQGRLKPAKVWIAGEKV
ncbi:MAG: imidazolonepropionase [Chitinophagaceae bacterium]